jgi:hypothetical protein
MTNNQCGEIPVNPNCDLVNKDSPNICDKCSSGYTLIVNGQCTSSLLTNCQLVGLNGKCVVCVENTVQSIYSDDCVPAIG